MKSRRNKEQGKDRINESGKILSVLSILSICRVHYMMILGKENIEFVLQGFCWRMKHQTDYRRVGSYKCIKLGQHDLQAKMKNGRKKTYFYWKWLCYYLVPEEVDLTAGKFSELLSLPGVEKDGKRNWGVGTNTP